jgi:hypothetical protein
VGSVEDVTIYRRKNRVYSLLERVFKIGLSLLSIGTDAILYETKVTRIISISRFILSRSGSSAETFLSSSAKV